MFRSREVRTLGNAFRQSINRRVRLRCDPAVQHERGDQSVGAINASIIAGNAPKVRIAKLKGFWNLLSFGLGQQLPSMLGDRMMLDQLSAASVAFFGIPGFFKPRVGPAMLMGNAAPVLSYCDTTQLAATLKRFVDFDRINHRDAMCISVGAVNMCTGNSVYFDNKSKKPDTNT